MTYVMFVVCLGGKVNFDVDFDKMVKVVYNKSIQRIKGVIGLGLDVIL